MFWYAADAFLVVSLGALISGGTLQRSTPSPDYFSARNPAHALNYSQLLQFCGTATNAFVNVATSSDLHARQLLLLDRNRTAKRIALVIVSGLLLCFGLAARLFLSWYGSRRIGVARVRLRDQLLQAGATLFSYPK
jgi:hypothetical protein